MLIEPADHELTGDEIRERFGGLLRAGVEEMRRDPWLLVEMAEQMFTPQVPKQRDLYRERMLARTERREAAEAADAALSPFDRDAKALAGSSIREAARRLRTMQRLIRDSWERQSIEWNTISAAQQRTEDICALLDEGVSRGEIMRRLGVAGNHHTVAVRHWKARQTQTT